MTILLPKRKRSILPNENNPPIDVFWWMSGILPSSRFPLHLDYNLEKSKSSLYKQRKAYCVYMVLKWIRSKTTPLFYFFLIYSFSLKEGRWLNRIAKTMTGYKATFQQLQILTLNSWAHLEISFAKYYPTIPFLGHTWSNLGLPLLVQYVTKFSIIYRLYNFKTLRYELI